MNWPSIGTKRALSSAITSAILLSAVASMGVLLVGWSNSTLTYNQVQLDVTFSNKVNKLSEDVVVEYVWFGTDAGSNKFVNVTLSNISDLGLTITEIEFVNSTKTSTFTIADGDLLPDEIYSLEELYGWTSGNSVDIVVTTARGNIYTTQVLPQ